MVFFPCCSYISHRTCYFRCWHGCPGITPYTKQYLYGEHEQENRGLEEVVVTGYQIRRKKDEAGAISTVSGKTIANLPNATVDKALQGRAAGVLVQANNGIPGGNINVRIRGTGSFLAGNQPLWVVDGVQLNTRSDANFTQSNPLSFLNPNDIESIDILKMLHLLLFMVHRHQMVL